jgi:hypothetical protein
MTTTTTMATMMTVRAMATPTMMTMWMVTCSSLRHGRIGGNELSMVQGAVSLASQGKVQASIVPRGRREKQDGPAHKGYRK